MSTTMTIRLDAELKVRLDQLAATTHRSKSFLAAEAIRELVEQNEWQIQEIQSAIREADAGDFASDEELRAVFTKWGVDEG
jgi:predicted transcriptional regulator